MSKEDVVTRVNAEGVLEGVDTNTGAVVWKEKKKRSPKDPGKVRYSHANKKPNETHHWIVDDRGRKLWVPKGTNPDDLPRVIFPFCQVTCNHILQLVTEGKSINAIGQMEGFPPAHTIFQWLREHPEFKAQMKVAREVRADFFEGKVLEIAEEVDEDNVQSSRMKADVYKWAAEVGNPDVYGKKTRVTGEVSQSLKFVVVTGVPDPETIETTGTDVVQGITISLPVEANAGQQDTK